jgi:hypothetical protein
VSGPALGGDSCPTENRVDAWKIRLVHEALSVLGRKGLVFPAVFIAPLASSTEVPYV